MEDSNKNMYKFKEPLIKATIIKRNTQFTAEVELDGETITVQRVERKVTISGSVERPGTYQLLAGENIKELIELIQELYFLY